LSIGSVGSCISFGTKSLGRLGKRPKKLASARENGGVAIRLRPPWGVHRVHGVGKGTEKAKSTGVE